MNGGSFLGDTSKKCQNKKKKNSGVWIDLDKTSKISEELSRIQMKFYRKHQECQLSCGTSCLLPVLGSSVGSLGFDKGTPQALGTGIATHFYLNSKVNVKEMNEQQPRIPNCALGLL